jgi:hypothetical protein
MLNPSQSADNLQTQDTAVSAVAYLRLVTTGRIIVGFNNTISVPDVNERGSGTRPGVPSMALPPSCYVIAVTAPAKPIWNVR